MPHTPRLSALIGLAVAFVATAFAQQPGEKVATITDAWGKQETIHGFNEERQPDGKWFIHDPERPQPKAVEPGPSPTLGAKPPASAVVLFDGMDTSGWTGGPWRVADGYMEVNGTGAITSKATFGSAHVHVEFATPAELNGQGQDRGNSGVFLQGKYEIQVLDSYKSATYADGMVGAVYGQNPPLVNASRPPGEWQTYDIDYTAPTFDDAGKMKTPARVTVLLNNVKVQDDFALFGPTGWRHRLPYEAHGDGPISLQDHGHKVRYRNIWVQPTSTR